MGRAKPAKKSTKAIRPVATAAPKVANHKKLTLKDYLILNAIFSAFCMVQLVLVRMLLRDFAGLYFFFIFLMVSFLIVSVFDYFANKLDLGDQIEGNSEALNE